MHNRAVWFCTRSTNLLQFILDTNSELLKERIGRKVKTKYSIALLETEKYLLTAELLETFKTILRSYDLEFGLLKVDEKVKTCLEVSEQ